MAIKSTLFSFLMLLLSHLVVGQANVQSVTPSRGYPGQELQLAFFGVSTDFKKGEVLVYPSDGMRLLDVQVPNARTLLVRVYLEPNSKQGYRDFRVVSGGLMVDALKVFEVLPAQTPLSQVQWNYFENIDSADFYADAPPLFHLSLYGFKDLSGHLLELELSDEQKRRVLRGHQKLDESNTNLSSNKIWAHLEISPHGVLADGAALPNGFYQMEVRIKTPDGALTFRESHTAFFVRGCTKIDGGLPGVCMTTGLGPANFYAFPTIFTWNHDADSYDFVLYKLEPHHQSIAAIKNSFPLFEYRGITEGSFVYPRHAPQLEYGQVYAWQVRGVTSKLTNALAVESPWYWFTNKMDNPHDVISQKFLIVPQQQEIYCRGTFQFGVAAKDSAGFPVHMRPDWKVIPESLGHIDGLGNFTAGPNPGHGAVVASYAGKQDLSLIQVVAYEENEFTINIVEGLFGAKRVQTIKKLAP